jgi:hypothetical protein
LKLLAPVCRCGHRFQFGEFVRSALIDHRGWIQHFDCPECSKVVIKLETIDRKCHRYLLQGMEELAA